jgi:glucokinase
VIQSIYLCFNQSIYLSRISVERVVSGSGLVNIYEYLSSVFPDQIDKEIYNKIYDAGDLKGSVIATNRENCTLCKQTMDLFITSYGAEAGVAALKWLPYGSIIYLFVYQSI